MCILQLFVATVLPQKNVYYTLLKYCAKVVLLKNSSFGLPVQGFLTDIMWVSLCFYEAFRYCFVLWKSPTISNICFLAYFLNGFSEKG